MKIILIICALMMAGCTPGYHPADYPVRPPELEDCKMFVITNQNGQSITVARCPNSTTSTSYKSGKSTLMTIVVDGVEYVQKEK